LTVIKATSATIAGFLNATLRIKKIKDTSLNGLQVRSRPDRQIHTVGFAVDACSSTFEKASALDVDLLVVHHGIKWRRQKYRELEHQRGEYMKKKDMALYAVHLPLDLHAEYGNNMQLCRMLDVQDPRKFGRYHGVKIGYAGKFDNATTLDDVAERLRKRLRSSCRVHRFGKDRVRTIGIVSGGGGSMLKDACALKLDCFLVGEIDLAVYNAAREYGMNLIVAGHYATETAGVKALMPLVKDVFKVHTVFVDDVKDI